VLFGGRPQGGNAFTASIAWVSPDLSQKQEFVFKPEFSSNEVADAIPTGTPGEFALIRPVLPAIHSTSADDKRIGMALTFVQFH
jgi:hypothetical protein